MSLQIPPIFQFATINYNPSFFQQEPSLSSYITLSYANVNFLKRVGIVTSSAISTVFTNSLATNSNLTVLGNIIVGALPITLRSGALNGWSIGNSVTNTGLSNILIGNSTTTTFDNTVVIGNGASATSSNSIILGPSTYTTYIAGTLSLSQPILQVKTSYTFPLNINAIGYTFQNLYSLVVPSSNAYTTLGTLSPQLPIGVWYISYNNFLTATTIGTVAITNIFISATSSNTNTPISNINAQTISLSNHVFTSIVNPVIYGNNFIYNNTTPVTLFLTNYLFFSTGSYSCFGNITCTRLA